MENNTIALNLRRQRNAKNLTQQKVADDAGLSLAAYRKIEAGKSEPRVRNLQAIAKALNVTTADLVAPARELTAVRFRSLKRLRSRGQILADVSRWLADFNELETILGDKVDNRLQNLALNNGTAKNDVAHVAAYVREHFDVRADEPIRDICGLLEAHGIKVGPVAVASNDFFGLSIGPSDGGPAVVVNTWERISVERWIFTAAHELGHLVMHLADYDVAQTSESDDHEAEANGFASAFLMPDGVFRKEWDETYGLSFVDRVLKVKRIFRVSYRTVLYRLAANKMVSGNVWRRFQTDYQRRHSKTLLKTDEPAALAQDAFLASFPENLAAGEPEHLSRFDFPGDRLSRLVRQAIENEKISLARGAEILGRSLSEMRELSSSWVS